MQVFFLYNIKLEEIIINLFKPKKNGDDLELKIDKDNLPEHIAIIIYCNVIFVIFIYFSRTMGNKAGVETIRRVIKEADRIGIKYITLYAFSTENWRRPQEEVTALMKLLVQYLKSEVKELHKNEVVLRVLGEIDKLPKECEREIKDAIELTKNNKGLILNIAFNYGGRDEIVRAIKLIAEEYKDNKINIDDINSELVNNYLYTKDSPDPDLIIRPSGEQRLSNFLLWQCAYSEFWYSNVCWPDFTELDLQKAIYDYQNRDRRFGGV